MKTANHAKPSKVILGQSTDHILWDVEFDAETGQWNTVAHTEWENACWVVWHATGLRVVTNAGGAAPVRDFADAVGWLGVVVRKDGTIVPVEFHGVDAGRTGMFVKMLGEVKDGEHVPMPQLWNIALSDVHTIYFW